MFATNGGDQFERSLYDIFHEELELIVKHLRNATFYHAGILLFTVRMNFFRLSYHRPCSSEQLSLKSCK